MDPVGIAKSVGKAVARPCFNYTKKQIGYVVDYESNVKKVNDVHRDLEDKREEIQAYLDEGERQGQKALPAVKRWLEDEVPRLAQTIEQDLLKDEEAIQKAGRCCYGRSLNPFYRYHWSKKAVQKADEMDALIKRMDERGGALALTLPTAPPKLSSFSGGRYVALESREKKMNEILEYLKDGKSNRIGIWGSGGAGKSMFVEELARRAEQQNLFSNVIIAEISEFPDIKMIQDRIADRIGYTSLDQYHSNQERAIRLGSRIKDIIGKDNDGQAKGRKKLLLILDNMWKEIDLSLLGIPHEFSKAGCKLLVTSRREDICHKMDVTDYKIEVGVLNEEEAKHLFKEKIGQDTWTIEHDKIIEELLAGCSRLPLSVNILADRLKQQSLSTWKTTIEEMKKSIKGAKGIFGDTYSIIKMSYDLLKDEEEKMLFLLCCLFPSGSFVRIHDVLRYAIGLGLFEQMSSLTDAIQHVFNRVKELKFLSLLTDFDADGGVVKIHDDVREAGLSFTSEENRMFHVGSIPRWLKKDSYKKYTVFSIMSDSSYQYLDGQELTNLKLLHIVGIDDSMLRNDYFKGMQFLKVLHLSNFQMGTLPTSIGQLKNLEALLLERCSLDDMSQISQLLKLQLLSLKGSKIAILPKEIGYLVELKLLDLTGCIWLSEVPSHVLAKLNLLEGLYMKKSFSTWNLEGNTASLFELESLHNLQALEINLDYIKQFLTRDFPIHNLQSYRIHIAVSRPWLKGSSSFFAKDLQLNGLQAHDLLKKGFKHYMSKAETLFLEDIQHLKNITPYLDIYGLRDLKHLKVSNCLAMECCINSIVVHKMATFPLLTIIHLDSLPKFVALCHQETLSDAFTSLAEVTLSNLGALTQCALLAQHTAKLRVLKINNCQNLEYIFSSCREREERSENVEFSCLQQMHLEDLPRLRCICKKEQVCPRQINASKYQFLYDEDEIQTDEFLYDEDEIQTDEFLYDEGETQTDQCTLFQEKDIFYPQLEQLKLKNISNITALWNSTTANDLSVMLPNLQSLKIDGMDKLIFVWSKELCRGSHSFENIKEIKIKNCSSFLSVFSPAESYTTDMVKIQFAKLQTLIMKDLPKCGDFLKGDVSLNFLALKELKLIKLLMMKSFVKVEQEEPPVVGDFILFTRKVKFPRLEQLHLEKLDGVMEVWDCRVIEEFATLYPSLWSINMRSMNHLSHLWRNERSSDIMIHIKELSMVDCQSLVSLISLSGENNRSSVQLQFPCLQKLDLDNLEEFKCMMNGETISSNFPSLKRLLLHGLPKIKAFVGDHVPRQPLFDKQVRFPEVEELIVAYVSTDRLWDYNTAGEFSNFFPKLESLSIFGIYNLRYVWGLSLARGTHEFSSLKTICIEECESMKSLLPPVIANNTVHVKVKFPQLQVLELTYLNKFKCLLQGNVDMESPALTELVLGYLPEVETLVIKKFDDQENADMGGSSTREAIRNHPTIPLFNQELLLPCLEKLRMELVRKVTTLWVISSCQEFNSKFPTLREVRLEQMKNLKHVWSYNNQRDQHHNFLANLESLSISDCQGLQSLFSAATTTITNSSYDQRTPSSSEIISFPKLELLRLRKLNKFNCLVPRSSDIDLQALRVMELESLGSISSLVRSKKSSFEEGEVAQIERGKQVLVTEEDQSKEESPVWDIEEDQSEDEGNKNWDEDEDEDKDKEDVYEDEHSDEDPNGGALFNFNLESVGFPSLENMEIDFKVYHIKYDPKEETVRHSFLPKLKQLSIIYTDANRKRFPDATLQSTTSLKISEVENVKYLVGNPRPAAADASVVDEEALFTSLSQLQNLEQLSIEYCCTLKELIAPELQQPLHNLTELKIFRADDLNQIPWRLLPNLRSLDICVSLDQSEFLFPAESLLEGSALQHLEMMKIQSSPKMKCIITEHNCQEQDHQIVFPQLKKIELYYMNSLCTFNSSSCRVRFPSLEEVCIRGCYNLASFSSGPVVIPESSKVGFGRVEPIPVEEADLNKVVEKQHSIHQKKN